MEWKLGHALKLKCKWTYIAHRVLQRRAAAGRPQRAHCARHPTQQPSSRSFPSGLRIDPETFSRSRMSYYTGITYGAFTDVSASACIRAGACAVTCD